MLVEVLLEVFLFFVGEDDGGGEDAVAVGVLGGAGFALRSYRATGTASIGAGCFYLSFGAHFFYPKSKVAGESVSIWVSY